MEERELSMCTFKPATCKLPKAKGMGQRREVVVVGEVEHHPVPPARAYKPRATTVSSPSFLSVGDRYDKKLPLDVLQARARPSSPWCMPRSPPSRPSPKAPERRDTIQLDGVDVSSAGFARWLAATEFYHHPMFLEAVAPHLTRLDLARLGWGAAEATTLSGAMPRFTSCATLDLAHNQLGADGAAALAPAIAASASLTSIDLRGNGLGEEGWGVIVAAVCSSEVSQIAFLNLSEEGIGPKGAKLVREALSTLANPSLAGLSLWGNHLSGKQTKLLHEAATLGVGPARRVVRRDSKPPWKTWKSDPAQEFVLALGDEE